MIHTLIGDVGHFLVISSFVLSILAAVQYFFAAQKTGPDQQKDLSLARILFGLHTASVIGVVVTLFLIILNHYYEYHYAWSHSSNDLPVHYMISCFWEGQEGSFLLWIFWHALIGMFLMRFSGEWEAPVMTVFAFVQIFLCSMILGVVIPGLNIKIGSTPFILLRDAMDAPIFQADPNFVPEDGTGLNPLLQNYWMVIHPPTLFLGFALILVPFAYVIAGLWKNKFREWIRPALPWSLTAAVVLGTGIVMGAYWAYETLNFGGYWSWDPVENAVYIPWLVLVASYHTMLIARNTAALRTAIILTISSFVLVLYSTFLTRSGILGNASVHSFTDLGLNGQLLIYLFAFIIGPAVLLVVKWEQLPKKSEELSGLFQEFWVFLGITTLCLMAFQVLVPTSIPVWNEIVQFFGGISNMAPVSNAPVYYSKIQLWFSVSLAIIAGTAQFFWWRKVDAKNLMNELFYPLLITMLISGAVIVAAGMKELNYIVLLTTSVYVIVASLSILWSLRKTGIKLAGGAVAHVGVGLMLIGILFSSGYSRVISLNNTGLLIFRDVPDVENRENILLWIDEIQQMEGYELIYKGPRLKIKGITGFVNRNLFNPTDDPFRLVARQDIKREGVLLLNEGDTVTTSAENTYYEVEYKTAQGRVFQLFPRVQTNPTMGTVFSPDIRKTWTRDLYTYASAVTDNQDEAEWSQTDTMTVNLGQQFFLNDYVAVLENVEPTGKVNGFILKEDDIAVQAQIRVYGKLEEYILRPSIVIRGDFGGRVPEISQELGLKITFQGINPETNEFTFTYNTTQKDYIVLKAIQKPMINLLWSGTILMILGFVIAIVQRSKQA